MEEEGIERRKLQKGGKKWKNPNFSNMQTRLFITTRFDTSLKSSKQLGGKSVVGLAKQKSIFGRCCREDQKKAKMTKRMKRYIPENLTHRLTVSWA